MTPECPAWMAQADCRDLPPSLFFAERGGDTRTAKLICRGCASRRECLQYALDNNELFGVWGGMSERERGRLRRHRHTHPAARILPPVVINYDRPRPRGVVIPFDPTRRVS